MTSIFRVMLIIVSICVMFYVLTKIRNSKLQIEDSIFWIFFSFLLVIISIFPQIADFLSRLLGVQSTVNFVFLLVIFILLFHSFFVTLRISKLEQKLKDLTQELAIREKDSKE